MDHSDERITELLRSTESVSAEELLPLVYDALRRQAKAWLAREKPGQTLQPTALVHEAFLRLTRGGRDDPGWDGRRHFFGAAAQAMRQILINQARRKASLRHGGDLARVEFDDLDAAIDGPDFDVLALEEALAQLEAADPRARDVVNLRYFVGLTIPETAEVLGVSVSTIEREWRFLRTFLQDALAGGEES